LGHDPRNAIIGPGLINLDYSMAKDNHIKKHGENFNAQFRAEFFNAIEAADTASQILVPGFDDRRDINRACVDKRRRFY
jgi:hypothetical protein